MAENDGKSSQQETTDRTPDATPRSASGSTYSMDRLSLAFETSARRWELIVYPSLFAFIILAAYGFYLVFSLAKDVHYLAISMDSMNQSMRSITLTTHNMRGDMAGMRTDVYGMNQSLGRPMSFFNTFMPW